MLETLKASGDALKQLGATGSGLRAVEDIVADVESNMQHAAEITSVLSSGSVTGMVNSMSIHGTVLDEDELMRELELMDEQLALGDKDHPETSLSGSTTIKSILSMPSIPEERAYGAQSRDTKQAGKTEEACNRTMLATA